MTNFSGSLRGIDLDEFIHLLASVIDETAQLDYRLLECELHRSVATSATDSEGEKAAMRHQAAVEFTFCKTQ